MTSTSASHVLARARVRTGGPQDGSKWLEHVLGWILVLVVAMFVTRTGLL
ncbi:SCO1431 family membrane protein [Streptomyces sp. NRRL S-87]|nr:SCO1431 family membrane protein [Streptomyces sp. NRRL S-87]